MTHGTVRWLVGAGGPWWFRWSVRLLILAGVIALGFLPYRYDIGGDCRIVPAAGASIRAPIADEVEEILVTEGQVIPSGYVVARLGARDESAAIQVAKARREAAQAELDLLRAGNRPEDLRIAEQKVELYQILVGFREKELARAEQLFEGESASESERDQARKALEATQAMFQSARESLNRVEAGARPESIRAAESRLASATAALNEAERRYALREIRSPIKGRVMTPDVEMRKGHMVQPGDLIIVVYDDSQLRCDIAASEAAATEVKQGMKVNIRLNGTYGELLTGRVRRVSWATIDEREFEVPSFRSDREGLLVRRGTPGGDQRVVRVRVDFDDHDKRLSSGMTGYARITISDGTFWQALARPVFRFFRVEVWSWLP